MPSATGPSASLRAIATGFLAMALVGCTAVGGSAPASPPASPTPVSTETTSSLATATPEPSATAAPQPTDDEVADEGDDVEASPTSRPTRIPGCGTGEAGFFKHTDEVDRRLSFGDAEIELTTASIGMRDGSYLADDAIPGYIGLTKDELAVRVRSPGRVVLAGDGMAFPDVAVTFARWSDVEFLPDQLPDLVGPRTEGSTAAASDGTIAIVAPDVAGDYYVELGVQWQTKCLRGDGLAYSRIKVH